MKIRFPQYVLHLLLTVPQPLILYFLFNMDSRSPHLSFPLST